MARGIRRHLEHKKPPQYQATELYPAGADTIWQSNAAVSFRYSHSMCYSREALLRHRESCTDPDTARTLDALDEHMSSYHMVGSKVDPQFTLGGSGYTHSIANYGRVVREGLDEYARRIDRRLRAAQASHDTRRVCFYKAMHDVLAGIRSFHSRSLDSISAGPSGPQQQRLMSALSHVPFGPAGTFYEALVAANFIFYIDGCDSMGRFDQDLGELYEADLAAGRVDAEEGSRLVRLMWENIDATGGWNVAIGGSNPDGSPAYNALTLACLDAAKSIRRPNLALRIRQDMPEHAFDAALDTIGTGCGIPALYNDDAYRDSLHAAHLGIAPEDLADYAFGGCTETMVHGTSNVGSLDAGINLLQVLSQTLGEALPRRTSRGTMRGAATFDELLRAYRSALRHAIRRLTDSVSLDQKTKARWQPQPIRSLLIDDCIDNGREYNAGGARYNWSVINIGGLGNVVDSLAAVRELVYEKGELDGADLLDALNDNFAGRGALLKRVERCPRFGNDDPAADEMAAELSKFIFSELIKRVPWRGGRFLPACLMFVTYAEAGEPVMATPDGRAAGSPIADSAGPVQGRDQSGPTAMIRSVTRLAQRLAPGTLVVNARFSAHFFSGRGREALKSLIRTYFRLGGMQIQINVVDQEKLKDAIAHPERHRDLIVRIGGYSEYFTSLTPALQLSVLERTEHTA